MKVTIIGAAGPTGLWLCRLALDAGHQVVAVSRRADPLPLEPNHALHQVRADAMSGAGLDDAIAGSGAVLSALGVPYSRHPISIYSVGTRKIVESMRATDGGRRLVVVSSGLTYAPPPMNWFADRTVLPLLRHIIGRTLYADMRRMEEFLADVDDIDWTVMRPGRLLDADGVSEYRVDPDSPTHSVTMRPDLAAAMVDELTRTDHLHRAVAPSTIRRRVSS